MGDSQSCISRGSRRFVKGKKNDDPSALDPGKVDGPSGIVAEMSNPLRK